MSGKLEALSHTSKGAARGFRPLRWPIWRRNLFAGAIATLLVLILNLVILSQSKTRSAQFTDVPENYHKSSLVLWQDSCSRADSLTTWGHLVINILSTILLTASAACMQCLGAPSRSDIDTAHRNGVSLRIALLSLSNFRYMSNKRRALWLLMALTSIPLHLLYNSALFTTSTTTQTMSLLVTGGSTETSLAAQVEAGWNDVDSSIQPLASDWFHNSASFTNLSYPECLEQLTREDDAAHGNMILFSTSQTGHGNVLLDFDVSDGLHAPGWTNGCSPTLMYNEIIFNHSWSSQAPGDRWFSMCVEQSYYWEPLSDPLTSGYFTIDHCMVSPSVDGTCLVELNATSMIIVIVVNVIKLLVLLYVSCSSDFAPLITVGDAIASFLEEPDPVTAGLGIVTSGNLAAVENARSAKGGSGWSYKDSNDHYLPGKAFTHLSYHWGHSVSRKRWSWTLLPWTAAIIAAFVGFGISCGNLVWTSWGRRSSGGVIYGTADNNFATNVLIANTPQLLLSLYYLLFNSLVTTMLVADEFASFAWKRKPLRVSNPTGSQRSTYWLQIPFRFGIPLTGLSIFLHWLMSQAIFAVHIDVLDPFGKPTSSGSDAIVKCDAALLVLLLCSLLMAVGITLLARLMRFGSGTVLIAHDSMAIGAAAHPQKGEPADMSKMPLMYGAMEETGPLGYHKVGFSTREVETLIDGKVYDCQFALEKLDSLWYAGQASTGDFAQTRTAKGRRTGPSSKEDDDYYDYI